MSELAIEQTLDMADYLNALRRRRVMVMVAFAVIFTIGVITAFAWPPTYQSSATILIEEQEIPRELVQSTVTSYATQRIQIISQRVMARSNLMEIIEKYNLYEKERKRETTDQVLTEMRDDINIDMITAEVMDPRTGRPGAATIAFMLGFKSNNPQTAQKVASELTTLYLNENLKSRTEKAAETYDFLNDEAGRLKAEISRLESKFAEFKEKNLNTLPDSRSLNTQSLDRAEQQLSAIDTQVQSLEERKIYLEGQIAILDPYSSSDVMSPGARLAALRTEYIRLASRYSPDHPDVANVKREIKALEQQTGDFTSSDELQSRLEELRRSLSTAEQTYTAEHPDVISLKRQVTAIESELANLPASPVQGYTPASPDNPAYVNLQTQLATANSEIRSLKNRRLQLEEKIEDYEQRLLQTPKIEQEYRAIARDLANASSRYQEIKAKLSMAEVGQSMEKERKGERFTLIDPAVLPEEPISPNRPAIIFLSLVLALGAGVGSAAVAESMDSTVRGTKGIIASLQMAPLAVIPYMANAAETSAQQRKRIIMFASVVAGIVIILLLVHFLVSPLDVLWFRGMRKVDNIVGE